MSAFRSYLLNLLCPGGLDKGEQLLHLAERAGDDRLGFESLELIGELFRLAPEIQNPSFDCGDVVLGQPALSRLGGDLKIQPADDRLVEDAIHFLGGFRDHPKFLSFMLLMCGPAPQEAAE